ncbi:MAG TPA: glycerophosphodiester phosphodiesterase family protein [Nordella sp.]|nr:glycerophosphodiester phosphodiesterase family protein [Nordella sp.]
MRKFLRWAFVAAIGLALFIFLNNTNLITPDDDGKPTLLAHRGIAQRYSPEGIDNDTCTAARILPPQNDYLENTIAAMKAAYDAGADMVEFDVHPTRDGQFAVFHDWTLDCRTNGTGVTREHSMAELKALDIGYGYTADGGKTYPFRGKGVGLMPTLAEVLGTFPDRQLMINVKSNDPKEGELLADVLAKLPPERRRAFIVYGGDRPVMALKQRLPDITVFSKESLKDCLYPYIAYGWTGLLPGACHDTALLVPINIAPWLWGWPNRFLDRMEDADTRVFALGPLRKSDGTAGIDSLEELDQLPKGYSGGIWTNEIGLIAGKLRAAGRL